MINLVASVKNTSYGVNIEMRVNILAVPTDPIVLVMG